MSNHKIYNPNYGWTGFNDALTEIRRQDESVYDAGFTIVWVGAEDGSEGAMRAGDGAANFRMDLTDGISYTINFSESTPGGWYVNKA